MRSAGLLFAAAASRSAVAITIAAAGQVVGVALLLLLPALGEVRDVAGEHVSGVPRAGPAALHEAGVVGPLKQVHRLFGLRRIGRALFDIVEQAVDGGVHVLELASAALEQGHVGAFDENGLETHENLPKRKDQQLFAV